MMWPGAALMASAALLGCTFLLIQAEFFELTNACQLASIFAAGKC